MINMIRMQKDKTELDVYKYYSDKYDSFLKLLTNLNVIRYRLYFRLTATGISRQNGPAPPKEEKVGKGSNQPRLVISDQSGTSK